ERLFLINFGLNLFDEREHIPHTQNARNDTFGVERIERIVLLTDANELDRLSDDFFNRKRCAAASIAVHLGQNNACDADAIVELFRALYRILSSHRVSDEERLDGLHLSLDLLQLFHQRVVYMQTARGIDHQGVEPDLLAMQASGPDQRQWIIQSLAFKDR